MIRIYLTPFLDSGEFGEEIEITSDVDGQVGKIKRSLDNSTYDIGILRYNNLNLKLQNSHGRYSDVENLSSVFRYRRSGSKVRVTWAPADFPICGVAICGETILAEEVTVFRGILNDDSAKMNIGDQIIQFVVLSYDSQFSKAIVPFEDLDAGDTLKEILVKILDQTVITKYSEVDADNIDLALDFVPDSLVWFENKTAKEAIEKILLVSNSVIWVDDETIRAKGRTPAAEVSHNFFGQASTLGNENVSDLTEFRNGQNRIINFVRWRDEGETVRDDFSISKWGAFLKELDIEFVTDPAKQAAAAESIVTEFSQPKKEFGIETLLDADTLGISFLDRVDLDYPTIVASAGRYLPIIGLTKVGDIESPLPFVLWDFQVSPEENFKIMGMEIDLKKETISFDVRGI